MQFDFKKNVVYLDPDELILHSRYIENGKLRFTFIREGETVEGITYDVVEVDHEGTEETTRKPTKGRGLT